MFEQAFKNIDDVLRKEAGCTTELDYIEQTSWLLFLKYLDALEQDKAMEAGLEGRKYSFMLEAPYRWESWAAPKTADGKLDHNNALELLHRAEQTDFLTAEELVQLQQEIVDPRFQNRGWRNERKSSARRKIPGG